MQQLITALAEAGNLCLLALSSPDPQMRLAAERVMPVVERAVDKLRLARENMAKAKGDGTNGEV